MPRFASLFSRWNRSSWLAGIGILAAGLAGFYVITYTTAIGPWAFSDSTSYVTAARNLSVGRGLLVPDTADVLHPLTWHPPLFSVILSVPMVFGADALQASRWLNALAFAVLIILCGLFTWRYTGSLILSLCAAGLVLASLDQMKVFSGVMSEGVFLVIAFAALGMLARGLEQPANINWLYASAWMAGLSYLARYTGIVLVVTAVVCVFLFTPGKLIQRLWIVLRYALLSAILPVIWMVFVFVETSTLGGRMLADRRDLASDIHRYLNELLAVLNNWLPFLQRGNFILSPPAKIILVALALLGLSVLAFFLLRKQPQSKENAHHARWVTILFVFIAFYMLFHLASFLWADARPAVDFRLLSPVQVAGYLAAVALFGLLARGWNRHHLVELACLGVCLLSFWYFSGRYRVEAVDLHYFGLGYTSRTWVDSDLIAGLSGLNNEPFLASNDPALVLFYIGRYPQQVDLGDLQEGDYIPRSLETTLILFRPQALQTHGDMASHWFEEYPHKFEPLLVTPEGGFFRYRKP